MAQGEMTVREAGRRGGETVKNKYGSEFYEAIGKKGGQKGGETTKRKYGHEFYEEIGKKGGQKVRELIERGKRAG
jgi:general stress protein YciG